MPNTGDERSQHPGPGGAPALNPEANVPTCISLLKCHHRALHAPPQSQAEAGGHAVQGASGRCGASHEAAVPGAALFVVRVRLIVPAPLLFFFRLRLAGGRARGAAPHHSRRRRRRRQRGAWQRVAQRRQRCCLLALGPPHRGTVLKGAQRAAVDAQACQQRGGQSRRHAVAANELQALRARGAHGGGAVDGGHSALRHALAARAGLAGTRPWLPASHTNTASLPHPECGQVSARAARGVHGGRQLADLDNQAGELALPGPRRQHGRGAAAVDVEGTQPAVRGSTESWLLHGQPAMDRTCRVAAAALAGHALPVSMQPPLPSTCASPSS